MVIGILAALACGLAASVVVNGVSSILIEQLAQRGDSASKGERRWPMWTAVLPLVWLGQTEARQASGRVFGSGALRLIADLGMPVLACLTWLRWGYTWYTVLLGVYEVSLLICFLVDFRKRIIPNRVVYPLGLISLSASPFIPWIGLGKAGIGLGIALVIFVPLLALGFGLGDVKLAAVMGLMTGFPIVLVALVLGIIMGGVGAAVLLISGRKSRRDFIPYGPFLVVGAVITILYGQDLWRWYFG